MTLGLRSGILGEMNQIEEGIIPPPPRSQTRRLDASVRGMKPGQSVVLNDVESVRAFRALGHYHGWKVIQRTLEDGRVRVWRME